MNRRATVLGAREQSRVLRLGPYLAHEVNDAHDEEAVLAVDAQQEAVVHDAQARQERRVRRQRRVEPANTARY